MLFEAENLQKNLRIIFFGNKLSHHAEHEPGRARRAVGPKHPNPLRVERFPVTGPENSRHGLLRWADLLVVSVVVYLAVGV